MQVQNRTKAFYSLLFNGKKPKAGEDDPADPDVLLKLISGGKIELSNRTLITRYSGVQNPYLITTRAIPEM